MLTQKEEDIISGLMKTSADDVIENKQTKTNIEIAHDYLERLQNNSNTTEKDALIAQTYSNLAIADQLVLLNRSVSVLIQIMIQQRSNIVMPQTGIIK